LATPGWRPKSWIIWPIRLRSFSIIWCSRAARISSPWATPARLVVSSRLSKWWAGIKVRSQPGDAGRDHRDANGKTEGTARQAESHISDRTAAWMPASYRSRYLRSTDLTD